MKKLSVLIAISIASIILGSKAASGQENEKIVTGTITLLSPSKVEVLDEFMSSQLYTGESVFTGWNLKLGAIYKNYENLSWDLYYTSYNRPSWLDEPGVLPDMVNPANSQRLKYSLYNVGYGTYYHWQFGEKLMLKAGGMFDLYGAMKQTLPDGVNNFMNFEGQIMVKVLAAIKYGWDFKKWALDLTARMSLPVVGIISADHPSEAAISIIGSNDHSIMNPAYNHIFLASYHNYMSFDYEVGIDFVLKPCTITMGFGNTSKWWNVYDIQNIRKINYSTIGVAFDLVSRDKFKSSNRNF